MTITVNFSDCHNIFNSTTQFVVNLSVYGATTSIGAISSLAAVVIILVAKGYKEFVYRLLLYMVVDCLIGFPIYLAYKFELSYNLHHGLTIPTSFLFDYFICVYLFLLCWLGLYLFLLAVFKVQIKKIKHEAIGLVIVLVTPLTFLWIFPWKKIALCGNTHSLKDIKVYWLASISFLSATLLSCLFTGAVLIILCKKAVKRVENNTLQQQYRKAVRETIPFVVFVITHQVFSIELVSVLSYQEYMTTENKEISFLLWEVTDIWPLCAISLPILLLSQSRIRLAIKCKKSPKNIRATTCTIHQSSVASQPSDTYFSAQHENSVSCCTHGDSHSSIQGITHTEHEQEPLLSNTIE